MRIGPLIVLMLRVSTKFTKEIDHLHREIIGFRNSSAFDDRIAVGPRNEQQVVQHSSPRGCTDPFGGYRGDNLANELCRACNIREYVAEGNTMDWLLVPPETNAIVWVCVESPLSKD